MNRSKLILIIATLLTTTAITSNAQTLHENAWVNTDKNFYVAGELLWFKLYIQPAHLSKLAFIEIISKDKDQQPITRARIALNNGSGSGSFQLPFSVRSGNYILRAYTNWMKNDGPASFYEKELTILNPLRDVAPATIATPIAAAATPIASPTTTTPSTAPRLTIHTNALTFPPRTKVSVEIISQTSDGKPLPIDGSMSVILLDSLQSIDIDEQTNQLSQTQTNPTSQPEALFKPEYAGMLITGKITDKRTGQPAPNVTAWLSAPSNYFHLATATSDNDGNIEWDLGLLYGTTELVVQTNGPANKNPYRVDILSPYSTAPIQTNTASTSIPTPQTTLLQHSIAAQTQNAYRPDLRQHYTALAAPEDTTAFYGRPDKRFMLDDYTRFQTMEEVMREYAKETRIRNRNGDFSIYLQSDQANQMFFDNSPLILMDGMPVKDFNNIIHFDPLKIRKMEVVGKRYYLGDTLYNGIISYSTYQGDLAGFPLDSSAFIQEYDGIQPHREFYSPTYEPDTTQRIPDLRNVLYWDPNIKTEKGKQTVDFFTSDWPGRYAIIVQALTSDGQRIKSIAEITIQSSGKK